MTINHHPFDLTLAEFAAGTLDEARMLVVATHVAGCAACGEAARAFERIRGVILEDGEPMPLAPGALQRALRQRPSEPARTITDNEALRSEWHGPLSHYQLGPWRRVGGRLHWRQVQLSEKSDARAFMLRAGPGMKIPAHYHAGLEWTCVLQGAFRHQLGRYGPGDFDEADDTVEHQPVVEDGDECVCLVALLGQIRLKGWLGRIVQPFVRI
jgi:putative transcriptional regulator